MDNLSLSFILFQVVGPKQWTTRVYISFYQKCNHLLHQKTRCHSNLSHHYQEFHSPLCRITEYQTNFIPRFVGLRNIKQISSPALSDYRKSKKTSFLGLPDYGRSLKFYFLNSVIPGVSSREVSLKTLSPLSYRPEPIR